ncbi:hypothetical protein Ae356Ps1_6251 [Pseudonocardia sp. Ae356_Ps1]|nr:hypothetical protein Ae356Ps1_6251 [Pseudonocardia sp. Ae356_Ps1]
MSSRSTSGSNDGTRDDPSSPNATSASGDRRRVNQRPANRTVPNARSPGTAGNSPAPS